jgi:hypothetical protein
VKVLSAKVFLKKVSDLLKTSVSNPTYFYRCYVHIPY